MSVGRRGLPVPGLLVVALTAVVGCSSPDPDFDDLLLSLSGGEPARPFPLPEARFTDHRGRAFELPDDAGGFVTLLFFGYTHCPDVCPLQMSTIAAGLDRLPPERRERVRVLFVTGDPERDTPERLASWLSGYGPGFVGLTAPQDAVDAALARLGFPPIAFQATDDPDIYYVQHPAVVILYTPDGLGRLVYLAGTSAETWAHDLELITGAVAAGTHPPPTDRVQEAHAPAATAGALEIHRPRIPDPPTGERAALYLEVRNTGPSVDTLRSVEADFASSAGLHRTETGGGMARMAPSGPLPVPAGGSLTLEPGGLHAMLMGLTRDLAPGDTVAVTLTFSNAGPVTVPVPVVTYAELDAPAGTP